MINSKWNVIKWLYIVNKKIVKPQHMKPVSLISVKYNLILRYEFGIISYPQTENLILTKCAFAHVAKLLFHFILTLAFIEAYYISNY